MQRNAEKHLWEYRWVQDLVVLTVVVLIIWAAYSVRAVVVPVLLAAALAYVCNPLVTYLQRDRGIPRWLTTTAMMLVVVVAVLGLIIFVVPAVNTQLVELIRKLPTYAQNIAARFDVTIDWTQIQQSATEKMSEKFGTGENARESAGQLSQHGGVIAAAITGIYNFTIRALLALLDLITYIAIATVVMAVCFFFFSCNWDPMVRWFEQFIPPRDREKTLHVLRRMDQSISAFIRGRLFQALVMGVALSVGWWLAGVPYYLLLGMGTGVANLIPFAGVIGCLIALVLVFVDHAAAGGSITLWVLLWPSVVYLIAQLADSWIVEPLVQGKATDLDPLTVLLAVLIAGSLAGLFGLIVAIPVTACIKIFSQEVVLPKIRAYVATRT